MNKYGIFELSMKVKCILQTAIKKEPVLQTPNFQEARDIMLVHGGGLVGCKAHDHVQGDRGIRHFNHLSERSCTKFFPFLTEALYIRALKKQWWF